MNLVKIRELLRMIFLYLILEVLIDNIFSNVTQILKLVNNFLKLVILLIDLVNLDNQSAILYFFYFLYHLCDVFFGQDQLVVIFCDMLSSTLKFQLLLHYINERLRLKINYKRLHSRIRNLCFANQSF